MPESIAALLVALLPVTAAGALTLGWWLHERVRPLVEPEPPSVREEYDSLNVLHEQREFALDQARQWSALARGAREQMGGQDAR